MWDPSEAIGCSPRLYLAHMRRRVIGESVEGGECDLDPDLGQALVVEVAGHAAECWEQSLHDVCDAEADQLDVLRIPTADEPSVGSSVETLQQVVAQCVAVFPSPPSSWTTSEGNHRDIIEQWTQRDAARWSLNQADDAA
jgi:hypothetical protein